MRFGFACFREDFFFDVFSLAERLLGGCSADVNGRFRDGWAFDAAADVDGCGLSVAPRWLRELSSSSDNIGALGFDRKSMLTCDVEDEASSVILFLFFFVAAEEPPATGSVSRAARDVVGFGLLSSLLSVGGMGPVKKSSGVVSLSDEEVIVSNDSIGSRACDCSVRFGVFTCADFFAVAEKRTFLSGFGFRLLPRIVGLFRDYKVS